MNHALFHKWFCTQPINVLTLKGLMNLGSLILIATTSFSADLFHRIKNIKILFYLESACHIIMQLFAATGIILLNFCMCCNRLTLIFRRFCFCRVFECCFLKFEKYFNADVVLIDFFKFHCYWMLVIGLGREHRYLRRPSKAMLTMSITPPRGCVISPSSPLPIPLKNPSTPSSEAPANNTSAYQHNAINLHWDKMKTIGWVLMYIIFLTIIANTHYLTVLHLFYDLNVIEQEIYCVVQYCFIIIELNWNEHILLHIQIQMDWIQILTT